jgi:hypothetical protein
VPDLLNYDPVPPRPRRWPRRVALITVLCSFAALIFYRQPITARAKLLYWQRQCLNYTRPPGTPVLTTRPSPGDADYSGLPFLTHGQTPAHVLDPACWREFTAA